MAPEVLPKRFQAVFQRPNPITDTERAEQPLISSLLAHTYLFETASKGRDLLIDLQMKSCILCLLTAWRGLFLNLANYSFVSGLINESVELVHKTHELFIHKLD